MSTLNVLYYNTMNLASNYQAVDQVPFQVQKSSYSQNKTLIVICVEFSNRISSTTTASIMSKIDQLKTYYTEISYGLITVSANLAVASSTYDPDSDGWYNVGTYNLHDNFTDPTGSKNFLERVYTVADPDVNFNYYDHIMIVCAGNDYALTYDPNDVRSHFSSFSPPIFKDGRPITNSSIVSELDPFSVYTHEFGHTIGLPDLYDIKDDSVKEYFVGKFGLMAAGSWNGGGLIPAGMMGFCRNNLSILDISATIPNNSHQVVNLYSLSETNLSALIKIPITTSTYYLLEFRKKVGTDSALPDQGVLITYVNESKGSHWVSTVMYQENGPVRIQDSHGTTTGSSSGLDDAPYDIGINEISYFNDNSNNVHIVLLQKNLSAYKIDIDRTNSSYDLTPPTTDFSISGWYSGSTVYLGAMYLNAYDLKSNINKTYYRINGGTWQEYTNTINVPFSFLPTSYVIDYYSTDMNGNTESMKSLTITVNNIIILLIIIAIVVIVIILVIYAISKSRKGQKEKKPSDRTSISGSFQPSAETPSRPVILTPGRVNSIYTKYCENCDLEFPEDQNFCFNCGSTLKRKH
ncbi:MAG: OmpL47-type beta-barrel domain-containing protein [Candidatus Helarchaeota archaeon]